MAIIINDTFGGETGDVKLNNHTPDTGGTWEAEASSLNVIDATEQIGLDSGGAPHDARNTSDMLQDDVRATADVASDHAPAQVYVKGVMLRMGSADQDGFNAHNDADATGIHFEIAKVVATIRTGLAATADASHVSLTVYTLKFEAKNNGANTDLEAFVDGVSILTHTESTNPFQGTGTRRAGIVSRRGTSLDNYLAETIVAGAVNNPPPSRRLLIRSITPTRGIYA